MRIIPPKPFTFEAGKRAVLLLHGFTGNTADVRMLGRYLQKHGYTCHAPLYKGHGVPPEELVKTGPEDWWHDVIEGYRFLKSQGYEEIAVGGLSLGGVFSLKLGYTENVKAIFTMCAPTTFKSEELMFEGVVKYAKQYKVLEGKSKEEVAKEIEEFRKTPMKTLSKLQQLNLEVRENLPKITAPIFVIQGRLDDVIYIDSANEIHDSVSSKIKQLKWYEESGHVITLGKEKEQLHKDVLAFLESLDWETDSSSGA